MRDSIAQLASDPGRAAIFLDVDGVLAPIVARPEDASVPPRTREALRRLRSRYALVACISGRTSADARAIVGVPDLVYVGNHGLELDPAASPWRERLAAFLSETQWPQTEDKELSAALHYREAEDEDVARRDLERIAERARDAGFVARFGRKVLEILPPLDANKGTAVRTLLERHALPRALYAGDDTTDLDAFAALDGLEVGVRVAVASDETPAELLARADLVVEGPSGVSELLARL